MSKESPFFKFDVNSWLRGAIQFCPLEEKGLFMDICAMYWITHEPVQIDNKFKARYKSLEVDLSALILSLSTLEVITKNEAGITVPFLDILYQDRQEYIQNCSKGGKQTSVLKCTSTIKKEERREKSKERRDKKDFVPPDLDSVIGYFKEKGYTKEHGTKAFDFYDVNDWEDSKGNKVRNWKQKMISVWMKDEGKIEDNFFSEENVLKRYNQSIEQRRRDGEDI